jgi:hypothetical protein
MWGAEGGEMGDEREVRMRDREKVRGDILIAMGTAYPQTLAPKESLWGSSPLVAGQALRTLRGLATLFKKGELPSEPARMTEDFSHSVGRACDVGGPTSVCGRTST